MPLFRVPVGISPLEFGVLGPVPGDLGNGFLGPGNGYILGVEPGVLVPYNATIIGATLHATDAPGGIATDLYKVRIAGVDTVLSLALTGSATEVSHTGLDIAIAPGEVVSVSATPDAATESANVSILVFLKVRNN